MNSNKQFYMIISTFNKFQVWKMLRITACSVKVGQVDGPARTTGTRFWNRGRRIGLESFKCAGSFPTFGPKLDILDWILLRHRVGSQPAAVAKWNLGRPARPGLGLGIAVAIDS